MDKKLSKVLWYGADKDALGKPVIPPLSPSVEKHLEGLNEGEIYIHNDDEYPALYIRTNKDKIVAIGGAEALMKYFLRKDQPDTAREVITFEKGLNVGEFVSGASGASFFKDLTTGQTIMELDKLYVRMKAFFETLTIVEAQTISGKQIISPAGSVRCTNVEEYDDYYRCYFLNEQDGEKIENKFIVGDQVYSQMFNAKTGTSNKISNRYYWRLVTGVGENYIDLSKTDCDAYSDAPMVGDVLNQRGHRYPENSERMNFIETSTVDGFSPSITLFHGVNSFSLSGKDYVQFGVDKTTNKAFMNVYGDMYVGDRNKTAYMRYTKEEGLVICGKLDVGTKLGDSYLKDLISASTPEGYQEFVEKVTQDLEGLQAQIDGTIDSYFFQYEPSLDNYPASDWDTEDKKKAHLNDTFTNLVDGRSWRWSLDGTYKWVEITDTATTKALALAGKAQDTADGKRRVFVDTPYPPYDKGDLWSRGSNYPLMICVVPKGSGVYAEGDFDYADNNAKLKEEMQYLVSTTKDELNNAIGQAKNEAVNNANKYTDEGKAALQESINALEESKANIADVYTQTQADGKISAAEERALKAAEEEADAAITYYDTIVKAYADGVATEEEFAMIAGAKAALDAAKEYAEEKAQAAKSEIENSYLFQALQDAQSTEIANGLVLTSLIQLRDTQSNIMSGINGLINASKGDKSIATWWGGGMYDLIDYYRWNGKQWVVKSGITAPSNIPSGLIRMDGTGYLAKGKFWWDNDGKIYADPTALFLSFDVDAEEGTLSATILDIRDKQTEFANMWTEKTDSNGTKYLYTTYPLVTQGGVTMYAGTSGLDVEGIYDGLPIDGSTIYWENGVLKAVGGGGVADSVAWADITGKPTFATVATSGSYNDLLNKPTLLSSFTNDVGFITSSGSITGSSKILKFQNLISSSTINIWNGSYSTLQIHEVSQGKDVPTNYPYGYLHNYRLNSMQWSNQLYFSASDYGSRLFTRGYRDDTDTWTPWNTVAFLSDIDSKLSGYLPLTGGTLTGRLAMKYFLALVMDTDLSNAKGISWKNAGDTAVIGSIYYHNTEQNFIINPTGASDTWSDALGKYSLVIGNNKLTYNTYTIYHSGNLTKLSQLTNDSGFITSSASISGNAASATKLATARTIWGQSFDGTGNISSVFRLITAAGDGAAYHKILKFPESPYGLITRIYDVGSVSLQVQRESNDSECFNLLLNPLGGNIGIGTTAPSYKLHVNGTLNATTIYQNGSSLDSLLGTKLNSSSYTAADILAKLKTVDGSGSGLDADTLDGVHESSFVKKVGRYSIHTSNVAPYNYIHLFRIGVSSAWTSHYVDFSVKTRHSSCDFYLRITTLSTAYGGGNSVIAIRKDKKYDRDIDLYYKETINSSGYNYYDVYMSLRADWSDGQYDIISNGGSGTLVFEDKRIYLDSLPDGCTTVGSTSVSYANALYTPRTIWGQSFDGTGNVSGDLSGVGTITRSNANAVDVDEFGNLKFKSTSTTDNWSVKTNGGVQVLSVHNNGNVGIGTTSPLTALHVERTASDVAFISTIKNNANPNSSGHGVGLKLSLGGSTETGKWCGIAAIAESEYANQSGLALYSSAVERVRINGSGYVGVGTTSPSYRLHVAGSIYSSSYVKTSSYVQVGNSYYDNGTIELYGDTPFIDFHHKSSTADYTTRLIEGLSGQLTCTGKFRIGLGYTTSTDYNFYVSGSAYISSNLLTGGGITMYSQRSLKNVIDEEGLSLRELSIIKPTRYTWKDKRDERLHIGGIADDIQQVLPEVVYRTPDGVLTMDYGNAAFAIASSLIKPMIEHESEIVSLKRRVRELEKEVKRLRA